MTLGDVSTALACKHKQDVAMCLNLGRAALSAQNRAKGWSPNPFLWTRPLLGISRGSNPNTNVGPWFECIDNSQCVCQPDKHLCDVTTTAYHGAG